jgi:hypothetical protein
MNMPSHEELYDRFVKGLESKHRGAFAAVRSDGQVIVDKDDVKVVDRALKQFGPGNFVLLKVGSRCVGKLMSILGFDGYRNIDPRRMNVA